jgi:hypothetical protein
MKLFYDMTVSLLLLIHCSFFYTSTTPFCCVRVLQTNWTVRSTSYVLHAYRAIQRYPKGEYALPHRENLNPTNCTVVKQE